MTPGLWQRWGLLIRILAVAVPLVVLVGAGAWWVGRLDAQLAAVTSALQLEQDDREADGEETVAPSVPELLDNPDLRGPKGDPGPTGPGPSDEQVATAVATILPTLDLADLLDPAVITAAVAEVIAADPPKDGTPGPAPTGAQILAGLVEYFAANPVPPGPAGPQGEQGPPPNEEQILAAVATYVAEHPGPYCPEVYPLTEMRVLALDGTVYDLLGCARTFS